MSVIHRYGNPASRTYPLTRKRVTNEQLAMVVVLKKNKTKKKASTIMCVLTGLFCMHTRTDMALQILPTSYIMMADIASHLSYHWQSGAVREGEMAL